MQIEVNIDSSCHEPKIIILTASMNDDVRNIIAKLSQDESQIISGYRDKEVDRLDLSEVIQIYASSGKVLAITDQGEYVLRFRLYELEKKLPASQFIRISNSEIINLKKVSHFDLNFTGTICVKMVNGNTTYVSRRYVTKLKKALTL